MKSNLRVTILIIACYLLGFVVIAQEKDTTYWKSGGINSATFSQVTLRNWSAGGVNSVAINGAVSLFADYAKGKNTWENSLDLGYGLIRQGDAEFMKSDDKINFVTKYNRQMSSGNSHWFFSGLLDFRTQFDDGFSNDDPDSLTSGFMAPGYLVIGLGADYKASSKLSFNYVPLTGKFTFVTNQRLADLGAYGVEPGSRHRSELGSYLRIKYKNEIFTNVNLESRLELFANYLKDFGKVDVNWQNALQMKINNFLTANWFTTFLYDYDIKTEETNADGSISEVTKLQFKSVFGVGLVYNLGAIKAK